MEQLFMSISGSFETITINTLLLNRHRLHRDLYIYTSMSKKKEKKEIVGPSLNL
jgi:hypothetical protein